MNTKITGFSFIDFSAVVLVSDLKIDQGDGSQDADYRANVTFATAGSYSIDFRDEAEFLEFLGQVEKAHEQKNAFQIRPLEEVEIDCPCCGCPGLRFVDLSDDITESHEVICDLCEAHGTGSTPQDALDNLGEGLAI